jgi:hypothetical protein
MNLEEKQERFEYKTPEDLKIHGEPFSPKPWNERLLKIAGRCPLGDPETSHRLGRNGKEKSYAQTEYKSIEVMSIKYPGRYRR